MAPKPPQQPTRKFKGHIEDEKSPKDIVANVIEQRKASMRYFNENYYTEFAEIYRNINARTKPYRYYDRKTDETKEDNSGRTNVCVPDHFVMLRRGTARLTRNPPNLRVRGGPDSDAGDKLREKTSAKLMFNWDRAESQKEFKKIVSWAYGMGWGVGKNYYDEVPVLRRLRKLTTTLQPQDFKQLAKSKDPQIAKAVQQFGPRLLDPTPLNPDEMSQMVATLGDDVSLPKETIKYKGPVLAGVFNGDVFPEPGFRSLNESGYIIENSQRDAEWLEYWLSQTTIDPETGEEKPVFDEKACDSVMKKAGQRTYLDEQELSLRRRMREEIEIADPITAGKPIKAPKKRFMCDERHTFINGHLAIDFIGEESDYLGRLWYPWDTYGRYQYSEMVLIPDWLGGIGMSTLRVTRFLMMLRNTRLNQTTDFINNKLLPLVLRLRGGDQTAYDLVRTDFARIVDVDNLNEMKPWQDPIFPSEAWQDQAQYGQQMQSTDPSISDYAPGTSDNPQAGKFATTAALQAKASDSVTADTLDQVNMFIRDSVELQLWMDQQAMDEDVDVPRKYFERIEAVSLRTQGAQARYIKVSPMDIQEDYEILPEAGSTLASDDQFRVGALQQFLVLGERHPDIVNIRNVITKLAQATPGVNPEDVILPPPPPQPPVPPVKMSITVSIPWDKLEPDVKAAILQHEALPTEMTHVEGVGKLLGKVREAADNASELERPVEYESPAQGRPNGSGAASRPGRTAKPTTGKRPQ
jgi:hypothetical protein